jgi:hypothetical protein
MGIFPLKNLIFDLKNKNYETNPFKKSSIDEPKEKITKQV